MLDLALSALQSLTIEVQASFLKHLTEASKDDTVTDFSECIDSAITARLRAVAILNELFLRQQQQDRAKVEPSSTASPRAVSPTLLSRSPARTQTMEIAAASRLTQQRSPSWNIFKPRRRPSVEEKQVITSPPGPRPQRTSSSTNSISSPTYIPSPRLSPGGGGGSPPLSTSPNALTDNRLSLNHTIPISPSSTISSSDTLGASGLCSSAYYILTGEYEKGVKLSVKSLEYACHCTKCSFATPAGRDPRGRPRFDDSIHQSPPLRFRSLFLFKSHIATKKSRKRQYRCMICVVSGDHSALYEGESHLFEHVAHHGRATVDGVELAGPICVNSNGLQIASEANFDVCFPGPERFELPPGASTRFELPPSASRQFELPPSASTRFELPPSASTRFELPPSAIEVEEPLESSRSLPDEFLKNVWDDRDGRARG